MTARAATLDVSRLPTHAFGARAPLWWGVALLVAIESTAMGILLVSFFYLRGNDPGWPARDVGRPALTLAAIELALLVASYAPMVAAVRAARRERREASRLWLLVATALGAAMLAVRVVEIGRIPFRWDSDAFGSVFWMTFGLHVTHVLTGVLENSMLLTLLWTGPVEPKHYGDLEASALLWYFSVLEWVPAFAVLYLGPSLVR